jgi:hypothetical protein
VTNAERLSPHNGLLLLPQYDKLFDRGFISFEDGGGIIVSPAFPKDKVGLLGISEDARLSTVAAEHRPFLSFHRDRVFIRHDDQE